MNQMTLSAGDQNLEIQEETGRRRWPSGPHRDTRTMEAVFLHRRLLHYSAATAARREDDGNQVHIGPAESLRQPARGPNSADTSAEGCHFKSHL